MTMVETSETAKKTQISGDKPVGINSGNFPHSQEPFRVRKKTEGEGERIWQPQPMRTRTENRITSTSNSYTGAETNPATTVQKKHSRRTRGGVFVGRVIGEAGGAVDLRGRQA